MLSEQQINEMSIKVIKAMMDRQIKGRSPSRATFRHLFETFFLEEDGPSSENVPLSIKTYLASRRIWRYYRKSALQVWLGTLADDSSW